MRDTSSVGGRISAEWTINTSLFVQTTAPTPTLRPDVRFRHFDSIGVLRLVESAIDEDADDILSGEETMLTLKTSPQDFVSYSDYKKRRGL